MKKCLFLTCWIGFVPIYAQSMLPAPQLISPDKEKVISTFGYFPGRVNIPIEFKWNNVSEASHYRIQIYKDSLDLKVVIIDKITINPQITLDSLYHKSKSFPFYAFLSWRVKSMNTQTNRESDWSETRFILLAMVISNENQIPKIGGIQPPYPNPFSTQLSIPIQISKPTSIQIDLYNVLGQHLKAIHQGILLQDITLNWNPDNLPNASYVLVIKSDFSVNSFIISHHQ